MYRPLLALLFVASFAITNQAFAQVRLGVKAGVNASNIQSDATTFDLLLGYQAGLMADIGLSSHFSIRPALLVNTKGASTDFDIRDQAGQIKESSKAVFRLIYAEIPVLMVYKGNIGKSWKWYGGLGPYIGIGITGSTKFSSDLMEDQKIKFTSPGNSTFTSNVYKRMDYGLNAALGVEKGRVQFGVNYSRGLTPMIPEDRAPNVAKIYNRTLALTVGYWFGK